MSDDKIQYDVHDYSPVNKYIEDQARLKRSASTWRYAKATALILVAAGILAVFCIATAFLFHYDFVDQMQTIAFLKNLGLAGGFLFIVANGTKGWSVDKEKKYVRL